MKVRSQWASSHAKRSNESSTPKETQVRGAGKEKENEMKSLLVGQRVRNSVVKFFLCAYRFAPESTTLGREDKRVKQILRVPIDDDGEEDLFSHLSDIVDFIGKKRYFH